MNIEEIINPLVELRVELTSLKEYLTSKEIKEETSINLLK